MVKRIKVQLIDKAPEEYEYKRSIASEKIILTSVLVSAGLLGGFLIPIVNALSEKLPQIEDLAFLSEYFWYPVLIILAIRVATVLTETIFSLEDEGKLTKGMGFWPYAWLIIKTFTPAFFDSLKNVKSRFNRPIYFILLNSILILMMLWQKDNIFLLYTIAMVFVLELNIVLIELFSKLDKVIHYLMNNNVKEQNVLIANILLFVPLLALIVTLLFK